MLMRMRWSGYLGALGGLLGLAGGYICASLPNIETPQLLASVTRERSTRDEPDALLVHAQMWPQAKNWDNADAKQWLLMQWSITHPEEAIAGLWEQQEWGALEDIYRYWAIRDPPAALKHFLGSRKAPIESVEGAMYRAVLHHHGAEEMIDLAFAHEAWSNHSVIALLSDAFQEWGSHDLQGALGRASTIEGDARATALAGIGKAWAAIDEEAALAWSRELPGVDGKMTLHAIVDSITADDPLRISEFLSELDDPFSYSGSLMGAGSNALKQLTRDDPIKALQWITKHVRPGDTEQAISMVFTQEAMSSNPHLIPKAIAAADESLQEAAIQSLVHYANPSGIDPAIKGTLELPLGEIRDRILRGLIGGLAYEDSRYALDYLQELEGRYDGDLTEAKFQIAGSLSSRHPQDPEVWEFFEQLPEEKRDGFAADGIRNLASHPDLLDLAFKKLESHVWLDEAPRDLVDRVTQKGARTDPEATWIWLRSTDSGRDFTAGYKNLFQSLSDIHLSTSRLAEIPHGRNRDAAIDGFVRRHAALEPETALAWAESIEDPTQRANALQHISEAQP